MSDTNMSPETARRNGMLAAAALAGTAAIGMFAQRASAQSTTLTYETSIPGTGDVKVLNYALALEDFESNLYNAALLRLTALGVPTTDKIYTYLQEFSLVEADHASFLRSAITAAGGTPISHFNYNFGALGSANELGVLDLVLQVEATGVRAYLGAIPLFTSGSAYLQTAAAIQGTEARHTTTLTILRNSLGTEGVTDVAPLASDLTYSNFVYDSVGYNKAKPNEGYKGIDVHLSPDVVLAAVSPFFNGPAS